MDVLDNKFRLIEDNLDHLSSLDVHLEAITIALKEEANRHHLSQTRDNWRIVSLVLTRIRHHLTPQDSSPRVDHTLCQTLSHVFRLLRNSLVNCLPNKLLIVTNGSILEDSIYIFNELIDCHKSAQKVDDNEDFVPKEALIEAIKCCLQFFANLLSGLDETIQELSQLRHQMWTLFAFDLFRYLLDLEDDKSVVLISSMIFYSCIRNNSYIENNLFETNQSEDLEKMLTICQLLLDQIESSESEWCLWSLQLFLKFKNFLNAFYNMKTIEVNDTNVRYLCQLFKQNISDVFAIDSQTDDKQSEENNISNATHVSKLLSILCELTANESLLCRFQTDRQLVKCLVDTLKTIQLLSKSQDSSHFKSIPQLKQINETDSESQNPVFGFKRDLIRVIGNLVYKCPQMQDWLREFDGIPLVVKHHQSHQLIHWSTTTAANHQLIPPDGHESPHKLTISEDVQDIGLNSNDKSVKSTADLNVMDTDVDANDDLIDDSSHRVNNSSVLRFGGYDRQTMKIVITVCGNQTLRQSLITLKSAVLMTKSRLHLIVMTDEYNRRIISRAILNEWPNDVLSRISYEIHLVSFPNTMNAEEWKKLFKLCAAQRLFLPDILKDIDSVLYVDTDVLFLTPVDQIWSVFDRMNGSQMAAMSPESEDFASSWYYRFAKHPYVERLGINSGVMLMNLTRMRDFHWTDYLEPYLSQYRLSIVWGDQDIINIIFHYNTDKLYLFGCHWNYRPDHCIYTRVCKEAEREGVHILHGNRGVFQSEKQPAFRAIYEAFRDFEFGTDLSVLLNTMKTSLEKTTNTNCGKASHSFTLALETYLNNN
ncbi:unnamed protein product [Oppiella nova]|uniref:UDP-D-xylose:beta-D-glucoside alpha-1,3-D-xylosyltransferase n=1 Tax=Oppiella nova TaxID=334625 RepID=A0A7R9QD97_9ACAR|nr:unnamed protein product [Oppiella nova]CAG2162718.1 unnamed protein product [Oppiella nova]